MFFIKFLLLQLFCYFLLLRVSFLFFSKSCMVFVIRLGFHFRYSTTVRENQCTSCQQQFFKTIYFSTWSNNTKKTIVELELIFIGENTGKLASGRRTQDRGEIFIVTLCCTIFVPLCLFADGNQVKSVQYILFTLHFEKLSKHKSRLMIHSSGGDSFPVVSIWNWRKWNRFRIWSGSTVQNKIKQ